MIDIQWYVIFAAFILDFILADPAWLPHPIVYMGRAIDFFEDRFRKITSNLVFSGLLFAVFLISSTWMITLFMVKVSATIHPFLGAGIEIGLLFYCFSVTGLQRAGMVVFNSLQKKDIKDARTKLAMIVGRQTQGLDETRVTAAAVESVAENFVDGFLSPLFFYMIGGVPLAMTYKMINTLDSMVGYRNETYIAFGKASARIDDAANFIPARLSLWIIAFSVSCFSFKKGIAAFKTGILEGHLHKSPNAGYPEAAFSGALQIKLGGPNVYHGIRVEKPYIGNAFNRPQFFHIRQACEVMVLGSFLAVCLAGFIAWLM